jgi:metal-dependent amidase/aminoacylase/carboxypeptidase family protein
VHSSLRRVVSGVAEAYGCTCQVDIIKGYPVTINDLAMAQLIELAAEAVLGTGHYVTAAKPRMASEDFSYVLQKVPGAMLEIGARPADTPNSLEAAPLHSNRMQLNEDVLHSGIAMHAAMAMLPPS